MTSPRELASRASSRPDLPDMSEATFRGDARHLIQLLQARLNSGFFRDVSSHPEAIICKRFNECRHLISECQHFEINRRADDLKAYILRDLDGAEPAAGAGEDIQTAFWSKVDALAHVLHLHGKRLVSAANAVQY